MEIIYLLCCFLQPICLPTPELATVLFGVATIGALKSFLLGVIGSTIGIICMYWISKRGLFQYFMRNNRTQIETYQSYVKQHSMLITGLLFVIPVLPDEIICVGAPFIGISFPMFFCIALISKVISIGSIAYSDLLAEKLQIENWQMIGLQVLLLVTLAFFVKIKGNRSQKGDTYEKIYSRC